MWREGKENREGQRFSSSKKAAVKGKRERGAGEGSLRFVYNVILLTEQPFFSLSLSLSLSLRVCFSPCARERGGNCGPGDYLGKKQTYMELLFAATNKTG